MRPTPNRLVDLREFPVLYVDDERENLRVFELSFRREFQILTARDAQEGLELLNRHPVALVLSDHKMPGLSGVEFLARVKELDARTVRILVTAYGDAQTLKAAIHNGAIYSFIAKPWNPDEMRVTLKRGIETYALERERSQLLHEFSLLHRASKAIGRELDIERLETLLLALVSDDFGYDAAALLDADAAGAKLSFRRFSPHFGEVAAGLRALELTRESAPELLAELGAGRAQLLRGDDVLQLSPQLRKWVSEVAAAEILVLPLLGKAGLLGALAVDNRRGGRGFTGDDRSLLEGLAQQAAAGLENARLFDALRRSQEQVQRADRLGVLGSLAAGLAHGLEAPLASVSRFVAQAPARRAEGGAEFWTETHALARRELEHVGGLLATLGRISRRGGPAPRALCDLQQIAEDALRQLRALALEARVSLALEPPCASAKLNGDRAQLQQLVLDLVSNAIQASRPGDAVRLRIGADAARNEVWLEVEDEGSGIPEEQLERLFDPFGTGAQTAASGGLGLLICQQVASDHGGRIEAQSEPGRSCFRVQLPAGEG